MTFKGASGSGKSKSGGSSKPKASVRTTPVKVLADKPAAKAPTSTGRGNRATLLVIGAIVLIGLLCICSVGVLGWTYGDGIVDFFRSMNIQ
jgi:hypothetical protein